MPCRRTSSRRARSNKDAAQLFGILLAIAIVIAVIGAAAVVVVPASIVILVLVLAQPRGAGARIRTWRVFQRAKGLEARRRVVTFATVLTLYGIVAPSICFAILVSAIRNSGSDTAIVAATAPTPGTVLATGTAAPSFAAALPSAQPTPVLTPSASSATSDPCHVNGVT